MSQQQPNPPSTLTTSSATAFNQLINDLQTTKLLNIEDYPGVNIESINNYLESNQVYNQYLGYITRIYTESDGYIFPSKMGTFQQAVVTAKILRRLGNWIDYNPKIGGRGASSRAVYTFKDGEKQETINWVMPDLSYISRKTHRSLTQLQLTTYKGDPFSPLFVLEVCLLKGEGSNMKERDMKMRKVYFEKMNIELGWLIDPTNKIMYEYYWNDSTSSTKTSVVVRSSSEEWRDLDGGDVLPGFRVSSFSLDLTMDKDYEPSNEDDLSEPQVCGICKEEFKKTGLFMIHLEDHREDMLKRKKNGTLTENVMKEPSLDCVICKQVFGKIGEFMMHYEDHREDIKKKRYFEFKLSDEY